MKQAGYSKRPFGRISERHRPHQRQTNGDSGESKVRGSPQQVVEKYLTLARDAASLGDPVSAEVPPVVIQNAGVHLLERLLAPDSIRGQYRNLLLAV